MNIYLVLGAGTALTAWLFVGRDIRSWPRPDRVLMALLVPVVIAAWWLLWLAGLVQLAKSCWELSLPAPRARGDRDAADG